MTQTAVRVSACRHMLDLTMSHLLVPALLLQRDASSDDDSEADAAAAVTVAQPASGAQQLMAVEHKSTAQPQLPAHPAGHSPGSVSHGAPGQDVAPPHWPSHSYGAFAVSSGTERHMQTAAAAAAADHRFPSAPLPHQVSMDQSPLSVCCLPAALRAVNSLAMELWTSACMGPPSLAEHMCTCNSAAAFHWKCA